MTRSGGGRAFLARFPDFPWDTLADAKARAAAHPDGIVDLSIGTPVDDAPAVAQRALLSAANAPGYPTVLGPEPMRQAAVDWLGRRFGVTGLGPEHVLATIGSKELIGNLPAQLGLGPDDLVVVPELAYPTYEVGARYAGCRIIAADSTVALGPERPALVYVNSPANPHGKILGADHLRKLVAWTRERGALLVSDECYLEFGWECRTRHGPPSRHQRWIAGRHPGRPLNVQAVEPGRLSRCVRGRGRRRSSPSCWPSASTSASWCRRRSRPRWLPSSPTIVHVDEQKERYRERRAALRKALERAGFRIDDSEGSLYLWATRDEPCRDTVAWLAERGILVAPGEFYGPTGARHVRVAFTATDERVAAAVARLTV